MVHVGDRSNGNNTTCVVRRCKFTVPGTVRPRFKTIIRGTYSRGNGRLETSRMFRLFYRRCHGIYKPCGLLGRGFDRRGLRDRSHAEIRFANAVGCGKGRPISVRNMNSNPVRTFFGTLSRIKVAKCGFGGCTRRTVSVNTSTGTYSCVRLRTPSNGTIFNVNVSRGVGCTSVGNVLYTVGHYRPGIIHRPRRPVFRGGRWTFTTGTFCLGAVQHFVYSLCSTGHTIDNEGKCKDGVERRGVMMLGNSNVNPRVISRTMGILSTTNGGCNFGVGCSCRLVNNYTVSRANRPLPRGAMSTYGGTSYIFLKTMNNPG